MAMGQAAGIASALSIDGKVKVQNIDLSPSAGQAGRPEGDTYVFQGCGLHESSLPHGAISGTSAAIFPNGLHVCRSRWIWRL